MPESQVRVFYILGLGHSGTTLLTLLLSGDPDVFAGGHLIESKRIFTDQADKLKISDGTNAATSAFWNTVKYKLKKKGVNISTTKKIGRLDEGNKSGEISEFYRVILEVSGASIIADNSRVTDYRDFLKSGNCHVFNIHVSRDVRGVIYSHMRKCRKSIFIGLSIRWLKENLPYVIWRRFRKDTIHIRYEDLVSDTSEILEEIFNKASVYFGSGRLGTKNSVSEVVSSRNLMFSGNRLRLSKIQQIAIDDEYVHRLPPSKWWLATVVAFPMLLLSGYPMRRALPKPKKARNRNSKCDKK